jgi:integrative and conjugative element protein (TIGR02256 family)
MIVNVEGWTILSAPHVIAEANRLRQTKLPNETGGVLLGMVDTNHRRIYVIDLLPSPSDSHEWPNLYIRGAAGLRNRIQAISEASNDNVNYVGEWHSHPPRRGPGLSQTDRVALTKLTAEMSVCGLPALMLIVAGAQRHQFHTRQANESPRPLAASARCHPRTTT